MSKAQTKEITELKRESLSDLAKGTGLNARIYPKKIIGYEKIQFGKWLENLNINVWIPRNLDSRLDWRVKDKLAALGFWVRRKLIKDGKLEEFREMVKKNCEAEIKAEIRGECKKWRQIVFASRYYLHGIGSRFNSWTLPLSRGILLSLSEAQETKQFCRFEIWESREGSLLDPVLVGFTGWHKDWSIAECQFVNKHGQPVHYLEKCEVTHKICEWE